MSRQKKMECLMKIFGNYKGRMKNINKISKKLKNKMNI